VIPQAQIDEYGEDLLAMVERVAVAVADSRVNPLKGELTRTKTTADAAARTTHQQAQDRMIADLDRLLPGWQAVDQSPDFLAWLREPDAFSGQIRQTLLNAAVQAANAQRVLAFFKAFQSEKATVQAPAPTAPATPGPKVPLDTFAAPPTSGGATPAVPPTGDPPVTYTQAQVSDFYRKAREGHYRGNPAEQQRIEALLVQAAREGRITD
jgi:hypothetical protein